jgi:hypothetical protein
MPGGHRFGAWAESGLTMALRFVRRSVVVLALSFSTIAGSAWASSLQQLCTGAPGAAVTTPISANRCGPGMRLIRLATQSEVATLQRQVAALKLKLSRVSYTAVGLNGLPTLRIRGANLQLLDGSGSTTGKVNGLGNLILGYDEHPSTLEQTGSHDLVLGDNQSFSSYGELIAGENNTASGPFADVFGYQNMASGADASVLGGNLNTASGSASSISGGQFNLSFDPFASITGGCDNLAGTGSLPSAPCNSTGVESVTGGNLNVASGNLASVSGGIGNVASSQEASVSGGGDNTADGAEASISGGTGNIAAGQWSSISGGENNRSSGFTTSILGGFENTDSSNCQSVPATNSC